MTTRTKRALIGSLTVLAGMIGAPAQAQGGPDSFQIVTPEIDIMPFQEITYCYYFRTPNARTAAISRWASELGPAILSVRMFLTTDPPHQPDP